MKYAPHTERFGAMDRAIERYFQVEAEIIADMQRRNAERGALAGDRIDRFLREAGR